MSKRTPVAYFHDPNVGNFYYGETHPMKPHRLSMTHSLVLDYDLHRRMNVFVPRNATTEDMTRFHTPDYVNFLRRVTPQSFANEAPDDIARHNFYSEDCPVFTGMFEFCKMSTGGSLEGAIKMNQDACRTAINWSGGLHHARKREASGFCYINDIVIATLELLKKHARVLYLDIDIHHGDGVQEAFYATDRVMTVSFHKYGGNFFPGTGALNERGHLLGDPYCVNVPLRDGADDATYMPLFRTVMDATMRSYQPGAVVLQCGADSLAKDRLGVFNLSIDGGHAAAVEHMLGFDVPTLVLGGGGYSIKNVARCWAYETAVLCGEQERVKGAQVPESNAYYNYFGPDHALLPDIAARPRFENGNDRHYVETIQSAVLDQLRHLQAAPSVQMQEVPPAAMIDDVLDDVAYARELDADDSSEHSVPYAEREGPLPDDNELFDGAKDQGGEVSGDVRTTAAAAAASTNLSISLTAAAASTTMVSTSAVASSTEVNVSEELKQAAMEE